MVKKIAKKSFVALGHTLGDFLLFRWYTKKNIDCYVTAPTLAYLAQARAKGKGVILSTAHFGSWELAAHYLAYKGFKSLILYNQFKKNHWLDAFVKRQREKSGNILVPKKNSIRILYKHLQKGGLVILLTDQHAAPPDGVLVPFLGHEAWTHTAFIKMSLKTGACIVPGFIFIKSLFRYCIEFSKPLDPVVFSKEKDPVAAMAVACNQALERAIVKAPGQWMWQHRRFKKITLQGAAQKKKSMVLPH